MDDTTFKTLRNIKPTDKMKNLIRRGRYIRPSVYNEMKRIKYCDYCHKKLDELPEIHHIIPIIDGGTNMRDNLMAVHKKCHEKLDMKYEVK